jgi:biopolymer transport protein TolR
MGMALGTKGKVRRGRRAISEINITLMVDVMLVLLIVFMVAAPLMTTGVPIDLPQTSAQAMPLKAKPITVTVEPDGALSIDGEPTTLEKLVASVEALATEGRDERLYVRGDTATAYGAIMEVMGELSAAGYGRIGLVTDPRGNP